MNAIPKAALDDRLAFVGTSGSGKTYAAGTAVERLLAADAKVVIVDPLDVWWGLRVKADGVKPAFPVVIFGGAHGDIPITENTGGLLGETVAGMKESCIVSLGGMATKSAERRFMLAFLEKLYRRATGEPFHLIFDEADLWAPQNTTEPQLKNLMEQIVRRGRVKGFIPWLITQRPAVLSKDVLSQADGLIAMKLISSQDRAALGAWIDGQADKADEKKMLAALPGMQKGHGIVWIPGRKILEETSFPVKTTFDSSSTPKRGETKRTATLKPIDIGKLKDRIAAIETDAKPKPKAPAQPSTAAPAIDHRAIREAEERAKAEGIEIGKRIGFTEGEREALRKAQAALGAIRPNEPTLAAMPMRKSVAAVQQAPRPVATSGPGESLPAGEKLCLIACAQRSNGATRSQVTIDTGYKRATRDAYILRLKGRGYVDQNGDRVVATADGISALGSSYEPLPVGDELRSVVLSRLPEGERKVLETLISSYPSPVAREEIESVTGYKRATRDAYILRLRVRELVEVVGRGEVKASDDLFSKAA